MKSNLKHLKQLKKTLEQDFIDLDDNRAQKAATELKKALIHAERTKEAAVTACLDGYKVIIDKIAQAALEGLDEIAIDVTSINRDIHWCIEESLREMGLMTHPSAILGHNTHYTLHVFNIAEWLKRQKFYE